MRAKHPSAIHLYLRCARSAAGRQAAGAASKGVDSFGPYFIEQYILMEVLSKQEVAQNVLDYYVSQKEKLQRGVERYGEAQGKGFICWRFIQEYRGEQ